MLLSVVAGPREVAHAGQVVHVAKILATGVHLVFPPRSIAKPLERAPFSVRVADDDRLSCHRRRRIRGARAVCVRIHAAFDNPTSVPIDLPAGGPFTLRVGHRALRVADDGHRARRARVCVLLRAFERRKRHARVLFLLAAEIERHFRTKTEGTHGG